MRALSHPARVAVLDHFNNVDEATATECARIAGLSPSAMSYHLRALAKVGLLETAPGRGDGRERVWRLKVKSFSVGVEADAPQSDKLAERALMGIYRSRQDEKFAQFLEHADEADDEWSAVTEVQDWQTTMTPAEMKQVVDQISKILAPYRVKTRRAAGGIPDGAATAVVQLRAFPMV